MGIARRREIVFCIILVASLIISFPSVHADFAINDDFLDIEANRTGTFSGSFSLTNNGADIGSISIALSSLLTDGLQTIPLSQVSITPQTITPFNSGTTETVNVAVTLNNANTGQFIGVISASSDTEHHEIAVRMVVSDPDSTPPSVISHSPSGRVGYSNIELSVVTNENAECRYSAYSGLGFNSMEGLFTDSQTYHTKALTLTEDKAYSYYVKCKDSSGNVMQQDYAIAFVLGIPPTAKITMDKDPPLGEGTVKVTVKTSENVVYTPSLSYSLDGVNYYAIPLSGSGNEWEGYFIIEEGDGVKVGSFEFEGTDLKGNTGNVVTGGKLFLVDTTKPKLVATIDAKTNAEGKIVIQWHYEYEIDHYNIYRSASPGVSYTDFYKSVDTTAYTDEDVEKGKTYYYKVSAVDEAGNEGDLSIEAYTAAALSAASQTSGSLSPELIGMVDAVITKADTLLDDIEKARRDFEDNDKNLATELGLFDAISKATKDLASAKKDLAELKAKDSTEAELERKLTRIELSLDAIEHSAPDSLMLLEEEDDSMDIDPADISYYLRINHPEIDEKSQENYVREISKITSLAHVNVRIRLFSIGYMDGMESEATLIEKTITVNNDTLPDDLYVYEDIPKTVAETVEEITFNTKGFVTVKTDPVVKWRYRDLGGKISYTINSRVSANDAKRTRTLLLTTLPEPAAVEDPGNSITGFSYNIFDSENPWGLMIACGVLVFLFGYYAYLKRQGLKQAIGIKPKEKLSEKEITELVDKANQYADEGFMDLATSIYGMISKKYPELEIQDEELHGRISKLCGRLNGMALISEVLNVENLLNDGRKDEAKEAFENVKIVYGQMDEEEKLHYHERYYEAAKNFSEGEGIFSNSLQK
ncbi:MAG: hypothetical protein ABIB71_08755 [Candidatus Woesearchaeota archaeon]